MDQSICANKKQKNIFCGKHKPKFCMKLGLEILRMVFKWQCCCSLLYLRGKEQWLVSLNLGRPSNQLVVSPQTFLTKLLCCMRFNKAGAGSHKNIYLKTALDYHKFLLLFVFCKRILLLFLLNLIEFIVLLL